MLFFFQYSVSGLPSKYPNSLRKLSSYRNGLTLAHRSNINPFQYFSVIEGANSSAIGSGVVVGIVGPYTPRYEKTYYLGRDHYKAHYV